jgi:hypothetical protein
MGLLGLLGPQGPMGPMGPLGLMGPLQLWQFKMDSFRGIYTLCTERLGAKVGAINWQCNFSCHLSLYLKLSLQSYRPHPSSYISQVLWLGWQLKSSTFMDYRV